MLAAIVSTTLLRLFMLSVIARAVVASFYTSSLKLIVKVLDFIKSGGPDLTVGSTLFEIWMRL